MRLDGDPSGGAAAEHRRVAAAYARRGDAGAAMLYSRFHPGHLCILQECERRMLRALRRAGIASLADARILEVGCGTGQWLRQLVTWGAEPRNLAGVDLLADRIAEARRLCPVGVDLRAGSAAELDLDSSSFDVVLQVTLFTSVLDPAVRARIAGEMMRVVRPDGIILWYDFHLDNPRNPDVRGVSASEVRALFPGHRVELERITLAPPIVRAVAPRSWLLAWVLGRVPFLCSHLLGVITPQGSADRVPLAPTRSRSGVADG
jgi:SAM-dependent methyltransferase